MKKRMGSFLFLLILLIVAGCGSSKQSDYSGEAVYGKDDYKKIIPSTNQLAFSLLPELEKDLNGNIFISPTSLFTALSMVYNGAENQTKEEIATVLQSQGMNVQDLNTANASWMNQLHKDSDKMQLHVANSIWLNENYHFQDEFAETVRQYFQAEIEKIDVSHSQSTRIINDWVKKSTNEKITEIVSPPLNPDLVTLLLNVIYFKGEWQFAFDKEQTTRDVFYVEDGTQKDVAFMKLKEKLSYLENEHFQAISLPYSDEKIHMKVFLPKSNTNSLTDFQSLLTNENWQKWNAEFQTKEGTVLLPKFQLAYETLLNEPLQKLGMKTAFTESATLTKMIQGNEKLFIDVIKQKTYLDVSEEGTEAAAVTSVEVVMEMASADPSFYMKIDRPFYIAITDEETGAILFMGWIANPLQNQ